MAEQKDQPKPAPRSHQARQGAEERAERTPDVGQDKGQQERERRAHGPDEATADPKAVRKAQENKQPEDERSEAERQRDAEQAFEDGPHSWSPTQGTAGR